MHAEQRPRARAEGPARRGAHRVPQGARDRSGPTACHRPRWRSSNGRSASGSRRRRPKPQIDQLRTDARGLNAPPLLNPGSREPICAEPSARVEPADILNFIGTASGINVTYDQQYIDKPYSVNLDGVTRRRGAAAGALGQRLLLQGHQPAHDPRHPRSAGEAPAVRRAGDEDVLPLPRRRDRARADARTPSCASRRWRCSRMIMPNKTANTITVRATAPVMDIIERLIRANDKPRAEVVLDVEILEVNRNRHQALRHQPEPATRWACMFSPEVAPPNTSSAGTSPPPAAAVQPEHDQPGRQHRRLLPRRAVGAGQLPRERLAHARRWRSRSSAAQKGRR